MQSDDPAFLPAGTEVSAKFKGAFCEAKIKKLCKSVKCKVLLKESPFGSIVVEEHLVKGTLEANQTVDITHGKHQVKGVIQHVKDCSTYHVVFNDGDEKVLRRTQMCLKGAKHFDTESNLDQMPLYNPEQFCAAPKPQAKKKKSKKQKRRRDDDSEDSDGKKRKKRAAASAASVAIGEMDQGDTEGSGDADLSGSDDGSSDEEEAEREKKKKEEEEKKEELSRKSQSQKTGANRMEELREKFREGIAVCVYEDSNHRGKWFPAVVVNPKVFKDGSNKPKNLGKNELPLRSFQNGKYSAVPFMNLTLLEDQPLGKKALDAMSNSLRTAVDRANTFLSKGVFPTNWTAREIFGENSPRKKDPKDTAKASSSNTKSVKKDEGGENSKKEEESKKKKVEKKVESDSSSSESSDEEEYGEERDLFVAQLYKFQEERGTPINRAPILGGKDIDLYRFYRVVQDYGGCKRVTTNQKWKKVLSKLRLEGCPGATPVTVRKAYIRYLAHFNTFYKRLGWSLDELSMTSTINSPRERRLIRPAELLNSQKQQPAKRKKSSVDETKEKSSEAKAGKKGKEADSKETSRDPELSTSRERSVSSPPSSVPDKSKKSQNEKDDDDKRSDRKGKDEDLKEKVDKKDKKDKKDKDVDKQKEKEREEEKEKEKREKEREKERKEKEKEKEREKREKEKERKEKEKEKERKEKDKEKEKEKEKEREKETKAKEEKAKNRDEKLKESEEKTADKSPEKVKERQRLFSEVKTEPPSTMCTSPVKSEIDVATVSGRRDTERDGKEKMIVMKDNSSEKKELDVSDEDGDGKKRKERKKLAKAEKKASDVADLSKAKDADEGYRPANIISRFYLGQKVRAHHHGRWYDARVVTVEQPSVKEVVEIMEMKDEESDGLSSHALTRLRAVLNSTRCFVHYLGWNSRYDESITLNKIRLSEKDDQSSLEAVLREMGDRIPRARLDFVLRWSNSTDGVESLTRDDVATPVNLFSMGGYRPRRVSISQYEQLSAAAAEGLRRECSKSSGVLTMKGSQPLRAKTPTSSHVKSESLMASPSSMGAPSPLPSPSRSADTMSHHHHSVISSPPPLPSKRARTVSLAGSTKDTIQVVSPSSSTTSPTTTLYVPSEKIHSPPSRINLPAVPIEEVSHNFEFVSAHTSSPPQINSTHSLTDKTPVKEDTSITCNEPSTKEKKRLAKIKEKTPVEDTVATTECYVELTAPQPADGDKEVEATDEHLRSTVVSVGHECRSEEVKQEVDVKVECEASAAPPETPTHDESDAEPSGSGTPLRTDGEDNDKWSTSDNQSAGGRMMSPGRGRGCKRKRAAYSRHSTMVVDRKYIRTKGKEDRKEDDSYGEEEEEDSTRDTFISMKNKTYRLMEQEHSLDNFDILGLGPLGDLSVSTDDAIEILEKRLSDLREVYHQSKAELLLMERRRRKRAEKRRERERASREVVVSDK
ncbi:hypothetical protein Q1695_002725 [Nippostrongylus brasiliensis]|nr:hypothetical protein Q1695_002725 [Nippostrongylus brasiliensis]